jgi:hypothetical protein
MSERTKENHPSDAMGDSIPPVAYVFVALECEFFLPGSAPVTELNKMISLFII